MLGVFFCLFVFFWSTSQVIDLVFSSLCSIFHLPFFKGSYFPQCLISDDIGLSVGGKTLEQYLFRTTLHPRQKFNNTPLTWIFEVTLSPGRSWRGGGGRKKFDDVDYSRNYSFFYEQLKWRNVSNILSGDPNCSLDSTP